MIEVCLGLGSNLGDRAGALGRALALLGREVEVLARSRLYETEPWGIEDQPPFLNGVLRGRTSLPPRELLAWLKEVEAALGRRARVRWGPREIDVDLLFYGSWVLWTPELQIPHPRLAERSFVLVPLAEVAPDWVHPVLGETVQRLRERVDASGVRPWGTWEEVTVP